ncbi:transcriptional regulator [Candidatus Margulisiibacteriota bacterium]
MSTKETKLIEFFKKKAGVIAYREIIAAGFSKTIINQSIRNGSVIRVERGLYSLREGNFSSNPDLTTVSVKIQKGVICLISALFFHEATLEIPHKIYVAIPRNTRRVKISYPPVRYYSFTQKAWEAGIEEHIIDGHKVKVYSLAKTIADCFKFRHKIGIDVARDALKTGLQEKHVNPLDILRFAKICRVDAIIQPLLETLI